MSDSNAEKWARQQDPFGKLPPAKQTPIPEKE